jgi:putative transposase
MNRIAAESLLRPLITIYGKHIVYSDGGTWCPVACIFLGLEHRLHSPCEKSMVERTIEHLKHRTETFDDY